MTRHYNGWKHKFVAGALTPISFVEKLAGSGAFNDLFREGMALVEEAAGYLDGPGRAEARDLSRPAALAYATESMRLTTRLMQVASWLLLQRAVNEGELTPIQARSERHRVKLIREELRCPPDLFEELPQKFRNLSRRSLRIQERVIHLDYSLSPIKTPASPEGPPAVAYQHERLRAAFPN